MKWVRRSSGFTIVELLVVIVVMGVVTTMGVVALGKMMGYWGQTRSRAELDARAEYALDQMGKDFASVASAKLSGVSLQGKSGTAQEKRFWGFSLEDDRVVIPVWTPDGASKVQYRVVREEGNEPVLVRTTGPLLGEDVSGGPTAIAHGVYQFCVEYSPPAGAGSPEWTRDWSAAELPGAVRVCLVVVDESSADVQVSRQAQFPIRVK